MGTVVEVLGIVRQLLARAEETGDAEDAGKAAGLIEALLETEPRLRGDEVCLSTLGVARHVLFEQRGDPTQLGKAVDAFRGALRGADGTPRWGQHASNLANALVDLFMVTARGDVLDEAVELLRQALRGTSGDDGMQQTYRVNLGRLLQEVARSREDVAAGDEAVELLRKALDREDRYSMIGLATALAEQAARSRDAQGLAEAAALHAEVAEGLPPGHPTRVLTLSNLGNAGASLFELTGTPETLDRALRAHRQALAELPSGSPDLARCLNNLANSLVRGFEYFGDGEALSEAVPHLRRSVELTAPSAARTTRLLNLGTALSSQFAARGAMADLEEAETVLREAQDVVPDGHPLSGAVDASLGEVLTRRHEADGGRSPLDEAITLLRRSVSAASPDHPAYALRSSSLAGALLRRFESVRHLGSLDEAVDIARQAVRTTPPGHPARALRMTALGNLLSTRYIHTGNDHDLEEARETHLEAVRVTGPADPHRSIRLSNLGVVLLRSHLLTGDRALLDEAISTLDEAVERAGAHPNLPAFRTNLTNALRRRFELDGAPADAAAAAAHGRLAADVLGQDHPDYAACQFNLA